MGLLDGRVVIVTGAGRGLGREHAIELARHGATVVVNDLNVSLRGDADDTGASPADEVVAAITNIGGTAVANGASVSDWSAMETLVRLLVGAGCADEAREVAATIPPAMREMRLADVALEEPAL